MAASGIAALAELTGEDFAPIVAARARTEAGLAERRERLAEIALDPDACVVLLGSWGRGEVTSASDDDAIVLFDGPRRDAAHPAPEDVTAALGGPGPGQERLFGSTVWLSDLVERIGLDADTNANLTRRMLFLLESVPVAGAAAHEAARQAILDTYLAA